MAYNRASALFLIAVLFAAASNPLAHGQLLTVRGLTVSGSLCYTPTGNCPGQGIPGVNLNCTILGVSTVVGRGITGVKGSFNITVPAITGFILALPTLPCVATVQLPLSPVVCPVLNATTGILVATVNSVGTLFTSVLGLVRAATDKGESKILHDSRENQFGSLISH
ncbi:hypothetical protein ACP275_09G061600 [Erythranthe tilingii]